MNIANKQNLFWSSQMDEKDEEEANMNHMKFLMVSLFSLSTTNNQHSAQSEYQVK